MSDIQDFIPEIWREANSFVQNMNGDVSIFHNAEEIMTLPKCIEAEKFCAFWEMESFKNHPHVLITLVEHKPEIDDKYSINDIVNPFECLQMRFREYYLLLKKEGMIDE